MKKKITAIFLCVALLAVAIGGATLAYFTDTDAATNTFTVGNVKIKLIEQERGEKDGKKTLVDFKQNKPLYPIVGSAQGDKDEFDLPVAKNYVDKVVTIKNETSEPAYIRAYFAIPSALDDGYETFNAGLNILHFNFGKYKTEDGVMHDTEDKEWNWKHADGDDEKWNYYETTIDGIKYNVYYADYYQPLAGNATTERLINGVYLDKSVNFSKDGSLIAFGKTCTLDEGWNWNAVKCPVFAVAVQTAGFGSVDEAVTEAFGANYNPWGGTTTNWQ